MKDFNQAIVLGNLTRDPELRYTPAGQAVASFAVATNRQWSTAEGEKKESVEYHDVIVWGKLAELVNQYLTKGRKVLVVGRLQTRSWEGQDGAKRNKTEIIASDVTFLDSRSSQKTEEDSVNQVPAKTVEAKTEAPAEADINIEEIPF